MSKRKELFIFLCGLMLTGIAIFCINHRDLYYISFWATSLLEHIENNNLLNFAIDLVNEGSGTNYNLFQNLNVALWISPLYIFSNIFHVTFSLLVYQTWIKGVIALLHLLCAKELYAIILRLGFDKRKAFIAGGLYFCSPVILIHGIGIGQIDCIGVIFLLVSIRLYLEKRYNQMAVAMGFALLSKFFVIMFYVPLFLLHFDKVKKTIKYVVIAIAVPMIDKILTNLLIKDFYVQTQYHNNEVFYPRLFTSSFNGESLFIFGVFVLCGIYLMIGSRGIRKEYHWLLCPMLIFALFFLLVFWHPQWLIYALPILFIMGCYIANEIEYAFFYFGMIMGYTLWSLATFNTTYYNAMLIGESCLGQDLKGKQTYISLWLSENVFQYAANIGLTVFLAAFVLLILLFYINVSRKRPTEQTVAVSNWVWILIMFLPILIYYVLLFMAYFGIIS